MSFVVVLSSRESCSRIFYDAKAMNEKYTDQMLDLKFDTLQEQMETRFDQILEQGARVENQTTKTNGHVAQAFRDIEAQKKFSWLLVGGWTIFVLFVVPALGLTMYKVWNVPTLSEYQIKQASLQGALQAMEQINLNKINP